MIIGINVKYFCHESADVAEDMAIEEYTYKVNVEIDMGIFKEELDIRRLRIGLLCKIN